MPHDPGQDHDERRQPAARVRLRADAERRRRPGAARVHHQQQHRRAPEGDPRLSEHRRRPEEGGRERWRAATPSPRAFYVDKLAEGIATIAAAFWPKPVIVRLSDFKSQRVPQADRRLALRAGGRKPDARLPRRLALHQRRRSRECFAMECEALKRVRDDMGLTNVELMVPFVRTARPGRAGDRAAGRSNGLRARRRTACARS